MSEALFVGRERETDLYKKFLARETPWVLIIIGLGGIGKSTLLHRLAEYTLAEPTLSQTAVVILDFANEELRNDPLKLLDKLTKDTAQYCDVQQLDVEFKKALEQNFEQLAQLSAERAQTGVSDSEDLALRGIRHQMRALATEAFYAQIKTFKLERMVIMLDTCEWLNEPEGIEVGQWVLNELVPGIHTRMRQKGWQCSAVMASRVQPRLDVIRGPEQRCLTLSMLEKAEVDQYLEHMGMQDPDLRQRVYEVTHGHALCVSIIGGYWQNREEQTQPFTIADLPELQLQEFSEIALIRFTNERVLKQLKSPFKELTRYGVLLRSFDLPLLRNVFPALLPEPEALEHFNHLIRYPYIESRGNYRYAFHELLREALAEETQKEAPEEWKCYHKCALDYFTKVSPHPPDWYYHLLADDEKRGLAEWQQVIQEARASGKREYTGALLQAALDKALRLSPAAHAEVAYEQGRFNYYGVQWEEALKSYKEALTAFQEVEDCPGQAKVLQAMGDVQRALAKEDDALESYQQARTLLRQMGDQFGEAKCSQAMGDVQRLHNQQDSALRSYEHALDLFRQVKDQSEEAKVLEALGDVECLRNEPDLALRSYQQALALYQEEKDGLKRAKVSKVIGDVQCLRKVKNAALESYGQALALFGELKEPIEEANVRRAIDELQKLESKQAALPVSDGQAFQSDPSVTVKLPPGSQPLPAHSNSQTPSPYGSLAVLHPQSQRRRGFSRGMTALLIALVLLIIGGGLISLFNGQAVRGPSTGPDQLATAQAIAGQTATATVLQNMYIQATSGSPVFDDSLRDNSRGNGWEEPPSNTSCRFTGGAYHASEALAGHFNYCRSSATNFNNFVYQVSMTIIKGDIGGLIFRSDNSTNPKFYYFGIDQKGSYFLYRFGGNKSTNSQSLGKGSSSIIKMGLNQPNLLAVVAHDSILDLYVNKQLIASATDEMFDSGEIGVAAEDVRASTEVAFSDAQVWKL